MRRSKKVILNNKVNKVHDTVSDVQEISEKIFTFTYLCKKENFD